MTEPKPGERPQLEGTDGGDTFGGCQAIRSEREPLCGVSKVPSPRKPSSRHIGKRDVMAPPGTITVAVQRARAQSDWLTGLLVCPPAGDEGGTGNEIPTSWVP